MKKTAKKDIGIQMLRYLDGTLPAEEVKQLNHDLVTDPKRCRQAAETLFIETELRELGRHRTKES